MASWDGYEERRVRERRSRNDLDRLLGRRWSDKWLVRSLKAAMDTGPRNNGDLVRSALTRDGSTQPLRDRLEV